MLIWFALTLSLLLAFAGFAVDFWHWDNEGARMQKAADAAALGGAVFMPENPGQIAYTTTKQITREERLHEQRRRCEDLRERGTAPEPAQGHDREVGE